MLVSRLEVDVRLKPNLPSADHERVTLVVLIVYVAATAWIGYDASRRDWSDHSFADRPWKWVVGSLLLCIVVVPLYLFQRGRVPVKP